MSVLQLTLWSHATATLALVGLIWFVQVVHYPLFARLGGAFGAFHRAHMERTGWVVAPLMLAELATAVALIALLPSEATGFAVLGVVLLVGVWLSTALVQVPIHQRLSESAVPDESDLRRLVRTNWIRTVAWSLRAPLALALAVTA